MRRAMPYPCNAPIACSVCNTIKSNVPFNISSCGDIHPPHVLLPHELTIETPNGLAMFPEFRLGSAGTPAGGFPRHQRHRSCSNVRLTIDLTSVQNRWQ